MRKCAAVLILIFAFVVAPAAAAATNDRDRDRLPDRWEQRYGLSTTKRSFSADQDRDGLSNGREYRLRTHPRRADTDRDGLSDGVEVARSKTDPRRADTDRDGVSDGLELRTGTDPLVAARELVESDSAADLLTDADDAFAPLPPEIPPLPIPPLPIPIPTPTPTPTPTSTPTATPSPTPSPQPGTCDRNATPSTLASQVSAATAGQAICLASGDYGTFYGTGNNKQLTLRAASGASPGMRFDLGSGDSNLTFEGFSAISGTTDPAPVTNLTFRNNAFNERAWMRSTATPTNIVFDNNTHIGIDPQAGDVAGRLYFDGSSTNCGYVVKNSLFERGGADGVRVGCRGVQILNNRFINIEDIADAHPDPIQVYGGSGVTIRGNYFHNATSEIAGYIQVTNGSDALTIEDNVFRAGRYTYVANLGAVRNSTFDHNTAEAGTCGTYNTPCGNLVTDQSSNLSITNNILGRQPNASSVQNNLFYGGNASGTNFIGSPSFMGPSGDWNGWRLANGSAGKGRANDGTDVGIG